MTRAAWTANLYLMNCALLFTHEIDSAFWREWELFRIPGGIQVFLVLNFTLLLVALWGFRELLQGHRSGLYFSLLLAGAGIFAFCIHIYFILAGHPQFTLPASVILLASIFMVSWAQGILILFTLRPSRSVALKL